MIRNKKYIYFLFLVFLISGFLVALWLLFMPVIQRRDPNLYFSDMLQRIDEADRIELWLNDNHLKTIDTPSQIKVIHEHFHTHYSDGWQYEAFRPQPPSGGISISFYNNNQSLGLLHLDKWSDRPYFLYDFGPGRFLNEDEFKELIALLEIDEELVSD